MKGFGGGGREDWRYWSSELSMGMGAPWEGDALDWWRYQYVAVRVVTTGYEETQSKTKRVSFSWEKAVRGLEGKKVFRPYSLDRYEWMGRWKNYSWRNIAYSGSQEA